MLFATRDQAWIFLIMAYGGVAIGILYDVSRIVRDAMRAGHGATMIVDAVFWLGAAAVLFAVILRVEAEGFRAYMLLGCVCGWTLYALTLSRLVIKLYRIVQKLFARFSATGLGRRIFR